MKEKIPAAGAMRLIATRPTMIITTLHENGAVNGGAFGAYTNLSPSLLGVAIGTGSDTYKNILRSKEFVINVPSADLVDSISIFGTNMPPGVSEVEEAGLTTSPSDRVAVPYIEECVAAVECRYEKEIEVGYHSFVVGQVLAGHCKPGLMDEQGYFDTVKARVLHGGKYPLPIYTLFGSTIEGK